MGVKKLEATGNALVMSGGDAVEAGMTWVAKIPWNVVGESADEPQSRHVVALKVCVVSTMTSSTMVLDWKIARYTGLSEVHCV